MNNVMLTQTFLIVSQSELPLKLPLSSAYKGFPDAGVHLVSTSLLPNAQLLTASDIVCHFAHATIHTADIESEVLYVQSLDKAHGASRLSLTLHCRPLIGLQCSKMSDVSGKSKHWSNLHPPHPHQKQSVVLNLQKEMTASSLGHHETNPPQVMKLPPSPVLKHQQRSPMVDEMGRRSQSKQRQLNRILGSTQHQHSNAGLAHMVKHSAKTLAFMNNASSISCDDVSQSHADWCLDWCLDWCMASGLHLMTESIKSLASETSKHMDGSYVFQSQEGTKQLICIIRMGTYMESKMLIEIILESGLMSSTESIESSDWQSEFCAA
ncbi:hypothetical protein EDC04DRAFT_2604301 [Pisolithus marmoratus]|nr:hypothetical protein EDC04DRAFT_2604301 [Pisolithus marmoratus]